MKLWFNTKTLMQYKVPTKFANPFITDLITIRVLWSDIATIPAKTSKISLVYVSLFRQTKRYRDWISLKQHLKLSAIVLELPSNPSHN